MGVAVILGIGAALLLRHSSAPVDLTTGTYLSPRRALPNFSLIDQRGHAFGPEDLRGRWSFLFFGYTNCPDFCPTTLTTLATLARLTLLLAGLTALTGLSIPTELAGLALSRLTLSILTLTRLRVGLTSAEVAELVAQTG